MQASVARNVPRAVNKRAAGLIERRIGSERRVKRAVAERRAGVEAAKAGAAQIIGEVVVVGGWVDDDVGRISCDGRLVVGEERLHRLGT